MLWLARTAAEAYTPVTVPDDLECDPVVRQLVSKLVIYRAWYEAALERVRAAQDETAAARRERDALKEEIRRYVRGIVWPE